MISTWSVGGWYVIGKDLDFTRHTCIRAYLQANKTHAQAQTKYAHILTHPPSHAHVHTCPCTHTHKHVNKHIHTTVHTHIVIMLTYSLYNCARIHSMHIFSLHTHMLTHTCKHTLHDYAILVQIFEEWVCCIKKTMAACECSKIYFLLVHIVFTDTICPTVELKALHKILYGFFWGSNLCNFPCAIFVTNVVSEEQRLHVLGSPHSI